MFMCTSELNKIELEMINGPCVLFKCAKHDIVKT
jgi:hypothetical protein